MIYHTAGYNQQFQFSIVALIFIVHKFTEDLPLYFCRRSCIFRYEIDQSRRRVIKPNLHGKNGFTEISKILAGYTDQKNNFVKLSK